MPPNPNVSPEFKHQLSAEQTASVDQAISQGKPVNAQEMALRNILQANENPEDAINSLASGKADMEAKWTTLEGFKTAGPLSTDQQQEYDRLERQIKGNQQLEGMIPRAYQQAHAEVLLGYQEKDLTELAADVNNLRASEQQAIAARDAARRAAGAGYRTNPDYISANERAQRAKVMRQEAEEVFNKRDKPAQDEKAKQEATQREQQRQQEENRVKLQRQELEGMDVKDLRSELTRLGTQETELQARRTARVAAGAGAEEIAEIDRDITRTQERNSETDRILGNKLASATEAIDKDISRQNEESFAERATSAQIRNEINQRGTNVAGLRLEVESFRNQLANPALTPAQKRDFQNQLYDASQRLQREEAVLKLYESTLSKSNKEFRAMNANDRAAELKKIADELDVTAYNRDFINEDLLRGADVTKEDMAAWTNLTVAELVENGRANLNMGQLNAIFARRPELRLAVAQGIADSELGRNFIRENFPNNWERMWDFARRNPTWLMILLAIIVGGAATAGVAVAPALGVVAGAGGTGAAGFGVSRRNWR